MLIIRLSDRYQTRNSFIVFLCPNLQKKVLTENMMNDSIPLSPLPLLTNPPTLSNLPLWVTLSGPWTIGPTSTYKIPIT